MTPASTLKQDGLVEEVLLLGPKSSPSGSNLLGVSFLILVFDSYPRSSMYGIFTYIWVIYGVNVGKYTIHG